MFDQIPVGPTRRFPDGKLREDDDGELNIAIGHHKGNVVIELGTPTKWVAFPPDAARKLAAALMNHASAVDGRGPRMEIVGG